HLHGGGCATHCAVRRACPVGNEEKYAEHEEAYRHALGVRLLRRAFGLGWWRLVPCRWRRQARNRPPEPPSPDSDPAAGLCERLVYVLGRRAVVHDAEAQHELGAHARRREHQEAILEDALDQALTRGLAAFDCERKHGKLGLGDDPHTRVLTEQLARETRET